MGKKRGVYRIFVGKHEEKRPLGRLRPRWDGNKKMDFRKFDGYMVWIDLAQDRDRWRALVKVVMKLRVP